MYDVRRRDDDNVDDVRRQQRRPTTTYDVRRRDDDMQQRRRLMYNELCYFTVSVGRSNGRVEITLPKINTDEQWSSLGVTGKHDGAWLKTSTEGLQLFHCLLKVMLSG